MVIGYDSYHDSTVKGRTVGAAVFSMDKNLTSWFSQCQMFAGEQEERRNLAHFMESESLFISSTVKQLELYLTTAKFCLFFIVNYNGVCFQKDSRSTSTRTKSTRTGSSFTETELEKVSCSF